VFDEITVFSIQDFGCLDAIFFFFFFDSFVFVASFVC
jgi:hypothetical protein